jgi:hypothetical protein
VTPIRWQAWNAFGNVSLAGIVLDVPSLDHFF